MMDDQTLDDMFGLETDAFGRPPKNDPFQGKQESLSNEEKCRICLCLLTPREQQVLQMWWGFDEKHPYTLEEIGQRFAVTSARVATIRNTAIGKFAALFLHGHVRQSLADRAQTFAVFCRELGLR
jgi:DNA-directed RNA polymerase specialized sigma subunit